MIEKISDQETQAQKISFEEARIKGRHEYYLLLNDIRSLHNVGAMFRTAEATLVKKIFLCGISGFPPRQEITKSALGAEMIVPWEYHENALDLAQKLKADGVKLIALELTHQSVNYSDYSFDYPTCLILGNEIAGVDDKLLDLCDGAIDIPMLGRANSLNVATACGIAVYEMLRQYRKKFPNEIK